MKLRRHIVVRDEGSAINVRWALVGDKGAVEFHGSFWKRNSPLGEHGSICNNITMKDYFFHAYGFECHSKVPFSYSPAAKCSHEHCELLGGPCWHDGSSLMASEWADRRTSLHNQNIFHKLESLYSEWLSDEGRL